jgi:[protein-PII] uridylyltransferase
MMALAATQSPRPLDPLPAVQDFLSPSDDRAGFLRGGQAFLAALAQWTRDNNNRGHGARVHEAFSQGHDLLFRAAWEHAERQWRGGHGTEPPRMALLAVGGYGNRSLCLRSDVDLMVLMTAPDASTEGFWKFLLLTLIDLKLDLSHVTRTIGDCLGKVGADVESVTSMSTARLLAGDAALFEDFRDRLAKAVQGRGRRWFLRAILEEWKARRLRYESTVYLLQPNLKEGQGGLRDADAIRWLLFGLTGRADLEKLADLASLDQAMMTQYLEAIGQVMTLRNELHMIAGNVGNLLLFEHIERIAERLGYRADDLRSAEECLLGDYYGHARVIDGVSSRAVRMLLRAEHGLLKSLVGTFRRRRVNRELLVQGQILYVDPKVEEGYFEADSSRALDMFHRAARWGYRLSDRTLERLGRLAQGLDAEWAADPRNHHHFMGILKQHRHVALTLSDMHESGVLGRLIPEFARIRRMVRIDYYHHYTVDEHTLKAIEMAERLIDQPLNARTTGGDIARQIERWDLLNLSLLLHDVGKGFGRGHALRGGQIAQRVGERMGLSPEDVDLARFLVLSHLKLSQAAQRRDITDPAVTAQLAEEIGDLERLKMLFVMTICDLKAVSPDAWTDWKGQMLTECFLRTAELLGGKLPRQHSEIPHRAVIAERVLDAFCRLVAGRPGSLPQARQELRDEVDAFFRNVSEYYLRALSPDVIALHCLLGREVNDACPLAWRLTNDPATPVLHPAGGEARTSLAFSQLTLMATDVPGLFDAICAGLAAKGINIWSAQIFSTNDGYAIDHFLVTDLDKRPLPDDVRLDRLRLDLIKVIQDKMTVQELIERHKTRQPHRATPRAVYPTAVIFDNASSKRYTVIEVRATDRQGLLYRIAHALTGCRLDIHRAMISTVAYGVVDVFYATDMEYNKIHSESDQEKIRRALLEAIEAD